MVYTDDIDIFSNTSSTYINPANQVLTPLR